MPTGNTRFHFVAGHLSFRSTSYDWMVVAGARVQYKGEGTVNGEPGYRFLITAIDGERPGGNDVDRLRVKIWSTGGVVYDNQLGEDDLADPSTAIGAGNIAIHP